jgi:hypothetical protein
MKECIESSCILMRGFWLFIEGSEKICWGVGW